MDKVGVVTAYCDLLYVCVVHCVRIIILIVTADYILCISWIVKCLIIIDARCKHEDYLYSVYFVNQPLHVSSIFVAHHQRVHC